MCRASARVDERLFAGSDELRRRLHLALARREGEGTLLFRRFVFRRAVQDVRGDVDEHGTPPAAFRKGERPPHRGRYLRRALHDDAVLGHGHGHVKDVHFLKAVVPELRQRDVARDGNERHAVHICVRKPRHEVGGSGTGRRQHHTRASAPPGIALCGETRPLFVRGEDMAYGRERERVIDGKDARPRIAEDVAHALFLKGGDKDVCTAQQHRSPACAARTL